MSEVVPKAVMAAEVRRTAVAHAHWDQPHSMRILHWAGGRLHTGVMAIFDPVMDRDDLHAAIAGVASEQAKRQDPDLPPPCAYVLVQEAWMASLGKGAPAAELMQLDHDAEERRIYQRPDRVEAAVVLAADVHGRLYFASKRRDDDEIIEMFSGPGQPASVGGRFAQTLLAVANSMGMAYHNLPGPPQVSN